MKLPLSPTVVLSRNLQSFSHSNGVSCFYDSPLEVWYQIFASWSDEKRKEFLGIPGLPNQSLLATIFYSFQRRLSWSHNQTADLGQGKAILELLQRQVHQAIFGTWKLYPRVQYGCAVTWMNKAITVSVYD